MASLPTPTFDGAAAWVDQHLGHLVCDPGSVAQPARRGGQRAADAALATLDVYQEEGLFARAASMAGYWEDAVHSLKGLPHVIDCRNLGIIAGIELEPIPGRPTARAFDAFLKCYEKGLLIRTTGDIIALSPPLILERSHIDEMFGMLAEVLRGLD